MANPLCYVNGSGLCVWGTVTKNEPFDLRVFAAEWSGMVRRVRPAELISSAEFDRDAWITSVAQGWITNGATIGSPTRFYCDGAGSCPLLTVQANPNGPLSFVNVRGITETFVVGAKVNAAYIKREDFVRAMNAGLLA